MVGLPEVPLVPDVPLVPGEVPLGVPLPLVPPVPELPLLPPGGGVVPGLVVVSLGGVAGVVDGGVVSLGVVVVPVPLVPVVPLLPEVVVGAVVPASLGGAVVVVGSFFLQAPSMAAMTAAVRMTFDAFEKAFIV